MTERWRSFGILAVTLLCTAAFLGFVDGVYPVREWLFWTVAKLWVWQLLLVGAMVAAGNLLLARLFRLPPTPPLERLTLAFAVGALVFGLGLFAAAALACLSSTWAVVWPTAMLISGTLGAPDSLRSLATATLVRPFSSLSSYSSSSSSSLVGGAAAAFGVVCLSMVYLGALSPDAISYDAAWTHLVIAQDYAREGRLVRFDADWPKNLAHFGSVINSWAFLVPGLGAPPVRWMMALHTEFSFFLATLVGVAAGVQWVAERPVRGGWATLFLFPGLFAYDSVLGGGNDHFAAFFVAPAFLAAVHGAQTMDRRWWAVFGALAGGALIIKYQAFYFLLPLSVLLATSWSVQVAVTIRAVWSPGQDRQEVTPVPDRILLLRSGWARARFWIAWPALTAASAALVAGPHFLRNWVQHRNPVYPFGQGLFPNSSPRFSDSALLAETIISHFGSAPPVELGTRLTDTFLLLFRFSLRTHEHVPVFGVIFTLCVPVLLFLPGARRMRLAALLALASIFMWGWTYPVERNLQVLVPLLAIATGAVLARAWDFGRAGRFAAVALVGVQLAWGSDHYFLQSQRLLSALALIRSGLDGRASTRFEGYGRDPITLGRSLPPDAKVLLHNLHMNLGIDRPLVHDGLGFQGLIDSRTCRTPRDLYQLFRSIGVTHVVYRPGYYPAPTKQEEVLFAALADGQAAGVTAFGNLRVFPMPATGPEADSAFGVLVVGIGGYTDGVYEVQQLSAVELMPVELQRRGSPQVAMVPGAAPEHLGSVDAVLLGESGRALREQPKLAQRFRLVTEYPAFSVWIRRNE